MKNHMITIVCLVVVSIICLVFTITCASGVDRFIGMEQKDNISPKKSLITENDYVADFSQLDCQYLQSTIENGQYVASAKFFGKVSESPSSPVVDFSEIWHFVKPTGIDGAKWLVAGIQQVNSAN